MKLNDSSDLLIEIGFEELPSKSLQTLAQSFREAIAQGLKNAQLTFNHLEDFVTPRRLALRVKDLSHGQVSQTILKKGPMKTAAFDSEGKPTKAALGFASACQTTVDKLKVQETEKGECLVFEQTLASQPINTLIPKIVQDALQALPIPKRMHWGEQKESFVRPVHWIVLLLGAEVIPATYFGIFSDRFTHGHRFHHPAPLALSSTADYESQLLTKGKVIPQFEKRCQLIETELKKVAAQENAKASIDSDLLIQVTGLVEWPVILLGRFDDQFLDLPPEVLISSMQFHQKCFPLTDAQGKLLAKFLIVANIESSDPLAVIQGNERVMHARLQDAAFYYHCDQKTPLIARLEPLKRVVFQHGLGNLWDKCQRITRLAVVILQDLNQTGLDVESVERAACLCKTDLLTEMVGEFPELQGVMGRHYALQDGESKAVAKAIEEHYHPRFAQDTLPDSLLGSIIALADRIDTLVGIFGLGKHPTGDRDPFALRRQALGILRIIIEQTLTLDLNTLIATAKELYGNLLTSEAPVIQPLLEFCFERLRGWYYDQGFPVRVFDAVLAKWPTKPLDFHHRLQAVLVFQTLPEAESLSMANKRVHNILSKREISIPPGTLFENQLLKEDAEKTLAKAILDKEQAILPLLKSSQYTEALKSLAALKAPIDQFFDSVMVMVEDQDLRNNRLKLLNRLRALFLEIADISLL